MNKPAKNEPEAVRNVPVQPPIPEKTLRREEDPDGPAEVGFDPAAKLPYHLNRFGDPIYHGCPEGFRYDVHGVLRETTDHGQETTPVAKEELKTDG